MAFNYRCAVIMEGHENSQQSYRDFFGQYFGQFCAYRGRGNRRKWLLLLQELCDVWLPKKVRVSDHADDALQDVHVWRLSRRDGKLWLDWLGCFCGLYVRNPAPFHQHSHCLYGRCPCHSASHYRDLWRAGHCRTSDRIGDDFIYLQEDVQIYSEEIVLQNQDYKYRRKLYPLRRVLGRQRKWRCRLDR